MTFGDTKSPVITAFSRSCGLPPVTYVVKGCGRREGGRLFARVRPPVPLGHLRFVGSALRHRIVEVTPGHDVVAVEDRPGPARILPGEEVREVRERVNALQSPREGDPRAIVNERERGQRRFSMEQVLCHLPALAAADRAAEREEAVRRASGADEAAATVSLPLRPVNESADFPAPLAIRA